MSTHRFRRVGVAAAVVLVASLILPIALYAWGEAGHRMTGEAAARSLPPSAPAFLRNAARELGYLNPEPDRWRDRTESQIDPALDRAGAPEHFIDMELVPPNVLNAALQARDRFAFGDSIAAGNAKAAVMGILPFKILEMTQMLRVDFRNWRAAPDSLKPWIEARIIDDAGILGHYVADGSNPLHTSVYYNGWTGPNPNGYATDNRTHARFESGYVGANVKLADVMSRMDTVARVFPDIRAAVIAYLRESNSHVEELYRIDKAHAFDANTTAPENKAFVVDRLASGAKMLRDLWWTAWVTSAPR